MQTFIRILLFIVQNVDAEQLLDGEKMVLTLADSPMTLKYRQYVQHFRYFMLFKLFLIFLKKIGEGHLSKLGQNEDFGQNLVKTTVNVEWFKFIEYIMAFRMVCSVFLSIKNSINEF